MKHLLLALLLITTPASAQRGPQDIHPYFSPSGGCTEAVVSALDSAKKTILVQAYSFTSAPIAKALVDAKKRGLDVQVILDKSQRTERYTSATFLANEGVPTYIDSKQGVTVAKKTLLEALGQFPNEGIIYYNLACYSAVDGRTAEAKSLLGKAVELNPQFKEMALEDEDLAGIW